MCYNQDMVTTREKQVWFAGVDAKGNALCVLAQHSVMSEFEKANKIAEPFQECKSKTVARFRAEKLSGYTKYHVLELAARP